MVTEPLVKKLIFKNNPMITFERDYDIQIDQNSKKILSATFESLMQEKEKGVSGYYNLPYNSFNLLKEIDSFT